MNLESTGPMPARVRGITCCTPRVLFAERAERVPGTTRSGGPALQAAQVPCASDVTGDLAARKPGEWSTARMADGSKASAWCDLRGDVKASFIAKKEGTCMLQTAALATQRWPSLATSTLNPCQDVASILAQAKGH